jgi:hypothetical protein
MTGSPQRSPMPTPHGSEHDQGQQDSMAAPHPAAARVARAAARRHASSTCSTSSQIPAPCCCSFRRPAGLLHVLHVLLCLVYICSTAPYTQASSFKLNPGSIIKPADAHADAEFPAGYVGICAVAKDQPDDIREWVEYHRWLGVGRIYLYDNRSKLPMGAAVMDYIKSGFVEYQYFSGLDTSMNRWAGGRGAGRGGTKHRWAAALPRCTLSVGCCAVPCLPPAGHMVQAVTDVVRRR